MKFGGNSPAVRIGATALFVGSVAWFVYTMWGMTGGAQPVSPPALSAPQATRAAATAPRQAGKKVGSLVKLESRLDPRLRLDLLKASEETVYKGSGRNIFSPYAAPAPLPQPNRPVIVDKQEPPEPQGPPPPPPINLKFYGYASRPGEPKKIFLAQGEDIFIGGEGDIVGRRYKIVRIGPNSVEIEDVLNNNRQSIPLTSS